MEGIRDGRAVDDCIHCVFVDPRTRPCPRCGNRMRFLAAEMTDDAADESALESWLERGDPTELLELLWRSGGDVDERLRQLGGPPLATLVAAVAS